MCLWPCSNTIFRGHPSLNLQRNDYFMSAFLVGVWLVGCLGGHRVAIKQAQLPKLTTTYANKIASFWMKHYFSAIWEQKYKRYVRSGKNFLWSSLRMVAEHRKSKTSEVMIDREEQGYIVWNHFGASISLLPGSIFFTMVPCSLVKTTGNASASDPKPSSSSAIGLTCTPPPHECNFIVIMNV